MALTVDTLIKTAMDTTANAISGVITPASLINVRVRPETILATGRGYQITTGVSLGFDLPDYAIDPNLLTFFVADLSARPEKGMVLSIGDPAERFTIEGATRYPGSKSGYMVNCTLPK